MICDRCHQRPAVYKYKFFHGDQEKTVGFCLSCMKEVVDEKDEEFSGEEGIPESLAYIIRFFLRGTSSSGENAVCPVCKTTEEEVKKTSLLGCDRCYEVFRPELSKVLSTIQTGLRHNGTIPETVKDSPEYRIVELRRRLDKAVEKEDYETAAQLRDEINRRLDEPLPGDMGEEWL